MQALSYIANIIGTLMPQNSELVEHEPKEIYVRPTNPNSKLGFKYGKGILISIEVDVLEDYQQAIDDADSRLLMLFKKSTEDLLRAWLQNYDPDGDKGKNYEITIDSRATDR